MGSPVVEYFKDSASLLEPPLGRFRYRRWRRMRKKLEYELFSMGGMWGSLEWSKVKEENNVLRVWE